MYRISLFLLFSAILCCTGCNDNVKDQKTIIVAHRGASHIAPENTVASTKLAFEKGADISEIDVYLSKDNRMIVIHDKTTKKTTGVNLEISETDSAELRKLDAGSWKSSDYAGEKLPFIEEIIAVIPQGKKLFIEIKCGPEIAPYLKKAIDDGGKAKQMEIISGNLEAMVACKKLMPYIPTYWVKATKKDKQPGQYPPYDESIITQAVDSNLTGLDLNYNGLTKDFVEKTHKAGLEMFVWTVNDVSVAQKMIEFSVDGITTDMPGVMKTELGL